MAFHKFVAVIMMTQIIWISSASKENNVAFSNCVEGTSSLHDFEDKLLSNEELIPFSRNKDQIVIITNVASF